MEGLQVHIRLKQRKARSYITIIENMPGNINNALKVFKQKLCCSGSIKDGCILLAGDHREEVKRLLMEYKVCTNEQIIIHGV